MTRTITVGSLFSGIGGLELGLALGLAREGIATRVLWQVEWNPYCRSVLARHFPGATQHGDITTLDTRDLEPVDVIVAGFPCQPVSLAGKGQAQDDDRWLWPDVARVLRDLRPRFALLENTPGLLSAGKPRGGALGEVLGDLARDGFDAWWASVRAEEAGAPHRRDRWFCLAVPVGDADRERSPLGRGLRRDVREERAPVAGAGRTGGPVADADALGWGGGRGELGPGRGAESPNGGELADTDGRAVERHQPERLTERGDATESRGGGELADTDHGRGQGADPWREGAGRDGSVGDGAIVADARAPGLGERTQRDLFAPRGVDGIGRDDAPRRAADRRRGDGAGDGRRRGVGGSDGGSSGDGARTRVVAEPCVGGVAHGLPGGVDGAGSHAAEAPLLAALAAHRWPAGRGEAQYAWEPPRIARYAAHRRERLSALGNAVVPKQAALALGALLANARRDGVDPLGAVRHESCQQSHLAQGVPGEVDVRDRDGLPPCDDRLRPPSEVGHA